MDRERAPAIKGLAELLKLDERSHARMPARMSRYHFFVLPGHLFPVTRPRAVAHALSGACGLAVSYGVKISFALEDVSPGRGPPEITYILPPTTAAPRP